MTKQTDNAVELQAERYLADLRAQRIAKAEIDLKRTTERLAAAQSAEQTATAQWSKHQQAATPSELAASDVARDRVVSARAEVEALRSLLDHHERAVASAKARHTAEQRTAAIELVTAERAAAGFHTRIDPVLEKIQETAAQLIPLLREAAALVGNQHQVRFDQRSAADQLGIALPDSAGHVPDPVRLTSDAVFKACAANDYSPLDWDDYVRPSSVMRTLLGAIPGSRAIVSTPDEDDQLAARRQANWQAQQESLAAQRAATQNESLGAPLSSPRGMRIAAPATPREPVSPGRSLFDEPAADAYSDRASLSQ